eukprot:137062-Chlamydomonas_euryale.AAC.4
MPVNSSLYHAGQLSGTGLAAHDVALFATCALAFEKLMSAGGTVCHPHAIRPVDVRHGREGIVLAPFPVA